MKIWATIGISLGLAVSSLAFASTHIAPSNLTALGSVDAVLKFCSKLNPGHAADYTALKTSMFPHVSAATLRVLESTPEYRNAFTEMGGVLAGAPRDWSHNACRRIVPKG